MILLTAHRRGNLGESMKSMFSTIKRIVDKFDNIQVIYPIHLNPIVRDIDIIYYNLYNKFPPLIY